MLFDFRLSALNIIEPWDSSGTPTLHWFGLTDGEYWLNVGEKKLLEYSPDVVDRFGGSRFCEYAVIRLYEDILEIAPRVFESVPPELSDYISEDSGVSLLSKIGYLEANQEGTSITDEVFDFARAWILERKLDTGYLSSGAGIIFWADDVNVHVVWNNTGVTLEGLSAWSEEKGAFTLSRDTFLSELELFHQRLMSQMSLRVEEVCRGALGNRVQINYDALKNEQKSRQRSMQGIFESPLMPTPWEHVIDAVSKVQ